MCVGFDFDFLFLFFIFWGVFNGGISIFMKNEMTHTLAEETGRVESFIAARSLGTHNPIYNEYLVEIYIHILYIYMCVCVCVCVCVADNKKPKMENGRETMIAARCFPDFSFFFLAETKRKKRKKGSRP